MQASLNALQAEAIAAIAAAEDPTTIEQLRVKYLGKKGLLTERLKGVGALSAEEKPLVGKWVNDTKTVIESHLATRLTQVKHAVLAHRFATETIDVTLPGRVSMLGSRHPVSRVRTRALSILSQAGFHLAEGPEIEDEYHNFEALNIPADHPARAMHDTFYVEGDWVLRTHTSPVQIRAMRERGVPIRVVAAGRVYRCDSDRTHTPMFHQMEALWIESGCTFAGLKAFLQQFFNAFFEKEMQLRFRPSYFPFTEPSAEVDIYDTEAQRWLEVMGCGMVHPAVLQEAEVDPLEYTGFAFGLGLDRMAMLRYHISDLRLLFENDIRFLGEF